MKPSSKLRKEKIESKNILKKLKSDYFLQKLFNNLLKRKSLDIIKYNKNIKNRINISIKDYKEYAEIYSPIEIEIKLVNNENGVFINVQKENEKYYHIYFDDNKEEIKRFYLNENENIEKIKVIIDYQIKTFEYLFEDCGCIEYIYFKKFYRNNINNMKCMFDECSSLKELNLSNFNTSNVIYIGYMFFKCSSMEGLNLSNFKTNKIIDMNYMFARCTKLIKEIYPHIYLNYFIPEFSSPIHLNIHQTCHPY